MGKPQNKNGKLSSPHQSEGLVARPAIDPRAYENAASFRPGDSPVVGVIPIRGGSRLC